MNKKKRKVALRPIIPNIITVMLMMMAISKLIARTIMVGIMAQIAKHHKRKKRTTVSK